jgi:hypothetical protein
LSQHCNPNTSAGPTNPQAVWSVQASNFGLRRRVFVRRWYAQDTPRKKIKSNHNCNIGSAHTHTRLGSNHAVRAHTCVRNCCTCLCASVTTSPSPPPTHCRCAAAPDCAGSRCLLALRWQQRQLRQFASHCRQIAFLNSAPRQTKQGSPLVTRHCHGRCSASVPAATEICV